LCIQENLSDMKKENISDNFQRIFVDKKVPETTGSSLSKANDAYNKMIKDGIIKKRGYTLRGIEDAHLYTMKYKLY